MQVYSFLEDFNEEEIHLMKNVFRQNFSKFFAYLRKFFSNFKAFQLRPYSLENARMKHAIRHSAKNFLFVNELK